LIGLVFYRLVLLNLKDKEELPVFNGVFFLAG